MLTMLGIPNCDTVKKARRFLERHGIDHEFRDIRKQPLGESEWRALLVQDESRRLINTRSPSFRRCGIEASDLTPDSAVRVLITEPTAMKRPVMLQGETLVSIGFSPDQFATFLAPEPT